MSRNIRIGQYLNGVKDCSFCGGDTSTQGGHWVGKTVVNCCPKCAVAVLPALLADSLDYGESGFDQVLEGFRLSRDVEKVKKGIDAALELNLRNRTASAEAFVRGYHDKVGNAEFEALLETLGKQP